MENGRSRTAGGGSLHNKAWSVCGRTVCCGLLIFSNHRKTLPRDPVLRGRHTVQGSLLDRSVPSLPRENKEVSPSFFDLGLPLE